MLSRLQLHFKLQFELTELVAPIIMKLDGSFILGSKSNARAITNANVANDETKETTLYIVLYKPSI